MRHLVFIGSAGKDLSSVKVSKRQIARIEAELVAAGLIKRTYPDRKSRSGDRVNGVIKRAAGINLAPLIEKADYIRLLVSRQMQADEDHKRLCEEIQDLFKQIRELGNDEADDAATSILPRRRPTELNDIVLMQRIAEALESVLVDFSADDGLSELAVGSDKDVRLITNKEKKNITRMATRPSGTGTMSTSPAHARLLAGPKLGEYIDLYACGASPDWLSITRATHDLAHELGISSRLWGEMCTRIGEVQTALCLIVADRNSQRGGEYGIDNPAASFAGLARKEARQLAVLDSLIGELTNSLIQNGGVL